jgi:hypothetical protein
MNASDIVSAKQNRTLFAAYYHPIVTSSTTSAMVYTSTLISSISSFVPEVKVCSTLVYQNLSYPTVSSYELANDINEGKYLSNYYTLSQVQNGGIVPTYSTVCNVCHISEMEWKNTNPTTMYTYQPNYTNSTLTSVTVQSTMVVTGPVPVICPLISFYQGTNAASQCNTCLQDGCCGC